MTDNEIIDRYEGIFHLETTAKSEHEYSSRTNETRFENREEAVVADDALINVYNTGKMVIIHNADTFEEKMQNLTAEIEKLITE